MKTNTRNKHPMRTPKHQDNEAAEADYSNNAVVLMT